jgi:hypothetical protein
MSANIQLLGVQVGTKTLQNAIRQMPFAIANAMTRTAREALIAGREEVSKHFVVRKNWIISRVQILSYARAGNLTTVLGINPRVQGAPLLLGYFEQGQGGTKHPLHGSGLAIPMTAGPARPSFVSPVLTAFRYLNLRLNQGKGRKRTFVVPGVGVFERLGPGGRVWDKNRHKFVTTDPTKTALVYLFRPSAPLETRMQLREAMYERWAQRFPEIFSEEYEKEIMKRAEHIAGKLK